MPSVDEGSGITQDTQGKKKRRRNQSSRIGRRPKGKQKGKKITPSTDANIDDAVTNQERTQRSCRNPTLNYHEKEDENDIILGTDVSSSIHPPVVLFQERVNTKQPSTLPPVGQQEAVFQERVNDKEQPSTLPPVVQQEAVVQKRATAKESPIQMETARRVAIAYLFVQVFNMPDRSTWNDRSDGVITQIRKRLSIPSGTKIEHILDEVVKCKKLGIPYTGKRVSGAGRPGVISVHSVEAQLIADAVENGSSIRAAHRLVNADRNNKGLEPFTHSAVYGLLHRLKPHHSQVVEGNEEIYDQDPQY